MQQMTLFQQIFSDAHLVDIDLSAWDKYIALYALAELAERPWSTADGRLPLFKVEFVRVRSWHIAFNHLSQDPPIELGPHEHIQWRIDDFDVQPMADGLEIALRGALLSSPHITLICEDVYIQEIPLDIPFRLFPGWNKPYTGFIRPALEDWVPDRRARR
jgi:hypothetical protein